MSSPFVWSREQKHRSLGNTGPGFYVNEQRSPRLLPSAVSQIQARILFKDSSRSENTTNQVILCTGFFFTERPALVETSNHCWIQLIHLNLKVGVQRKASSFGVYPPPSCQGASSSRNLCLMIYKHISRAFLSTGQDQKGQLRS